MFDPSLIPRVPPWFQPTPAALAALDAEAPVLLVQAPPGYGKTATVATWLDRGPERLAVWADAPLDSDGDRFLAGIARRLDQAAEFGQVVRTLSEPSRRPRPTLVVDRLDRLPEDVDARLLELALAAGARLVVIARRSRPLDVFTGAGVATSLIREDQLRLHTAEVLEIARHFGRAVSSAQAAMLVAQTDGWPGAVLAALRDEELPDPDRGTWQPGAILMGYAQTVLLEPEFHRHRDVFYALTAVDGATDALIETITAEPRVTLAAFSATGPIRLVSDRHGWRLPAVLRPALADLYERMDPDAMRTLQRRLHRYYADRSELDRALAHAVASQDARLTTDFIASHWPRLVFEARAPLAGALPLLEADSALTRFLRQDVLDEEALQRGRQGLLSGVLLQPDSAPEPDDPSEERGRWRLRWAWAQFFERQHVGAADAFWRLTTHPDAALRMEARSALALCLVHLGFIRAGHAWWAECEGAGRGMSATARACAWLVHRLLLEEGQPLDAPEPAVPPLAELPPTTAELAHYVDLLVVLPTNRPASTDAELACAEEHWSRALERSPLLRAAMTMTYVHRLIATGRLGRAREVLARTTDVPGWDITTTAWLDWLEGNLTNVVRLTTASLPGAGLVDEATRLSPRMHGQLLVLDGLAAYRLGRHDRAMNTLDAALDLTRRTGYWRAWALVPPGDVDGLLALLPSLAEVFDRAPTGGFGPAPVRGMVRLSPRETDVLRLWAQNRTVAQIAERLFISPNSVKSHLRSIYRKLGVNARADALERARQLSLFS